MTGYSFATAAAIAAATLVAATPAAADVRAGVDAWNRRDYATAIREWEQPAAAGDADAMFNLAQAYRLGRGVDADAGRAESLYAKAAALGHQQAADAYGLLLVEEGRSAEAMPYIRDAARRGDPRAQYVLGVSYFNGDGVEQDQVRAYALMTLSHRAGLPQAEAAIAEMDRAIAPEQRQKAAALAVELAGEGAAGAAPSAPAAEGAWRVQLGAFSVPENADRLWQRISMRAALAGKQKIVAPQGGLSFLFAGGYASRADAAEACRALRASGQDCLVTRD